MATLNCNLSRPTVYAHARKSNFEHGGTKTVVDIGGIDPDHCAVTATNVCLCVAGRWTKPSTRPQRAGVLGDKILRFNNYAFAYGLHEHDTAWAMLAIHN